MGEDLQPKRRMRLRGRLTIAGVCAALPLALVLLLADSRRASPSETRLPALTVEPSVSALGPPSVEAPAADGAGQAALASVVGPVAPALPANALAAPTDRDTLARLEERDGAFERTLALPSHASVRLRYTLDPELTRAIWRLLEQGRVARAHVVVMDLATGALIAYVSTDPVAFPPDRAYPAASLVKVVTAAAALDSSPSLSRATCRFAGSPYVLTRSRVDPPRRGEEISLERALATSTNQCFAQWAVHRVGARGMLDAIDRFGFLSPPAPDHPPGEVRDPGEDALALGQLGSGLDGLRITPLHAAQLAGTLARGRLLEPHWLAAAYDAKGMPLAVGSTAHERVVLSSGLAKQLRELLTATTERGTARRAFRPRGRPLLPGIRVAGKTGSLSGTNPEGRYEWFAGVAPVEAPRIAVATVVVQGPRWWTSGSQLAAQVFRAAFCPDGRCRVSGAPRDASSAVASAQHTDEKD